MEHSSNTAQTSLCCITMGQEQSVGENGRVESRDAFSRASSRTLSPEPSPGENTLQSVKQPPQVQKHQTSTDIPPILNSLQPVQEIGPIAKPSIKHSFPVRKSNAIHIDIPLKEDYQNSTRSWKRPERNEEASEFAVGSKRLKNDMVPVDLTEDPDVVEIPLLEIIDLEEEEEAAAEEERARLAFHQSHRRRELPRRNQPITFPLESLEGYPFHQYTIRENKVVEYRGETIQFAEDDPENENKRWASKEVDGFLVIKHIVLNSETNEVTLRGWRAIRTIDLMGKLETGNGTKNE